MPSQQIPSPQMPPLNTSTIVTTLRDEYERLQCLAVAQMAIAESFAERARTCDALQTDVQVARAKKEAYEQAALRLQGILDRVLGGSGASRDAEVEMPLAEPKAEKPMPLHPLVAAALNEHLPPTKRYDALVQLTYTKENVPADLQVLRDVYLRLTKVLPSFDSVLEVAPIAGLAAVRNWVDCGKTGRDLTASAQLTQKALSAIEQIAYPVNQQPLVEAAIIEIRRLGDDLAVRKMLGM